MGKGLALITGGAGFIGSHTAVELLRAGYTVRVLDNLTPPVHIGDGSWPDWLSPDVERMAGDVRNREDWTKALSGVDVVIHLAGYQDLLRNFSQFFHVNSVGTALLYELIVAEKLPVRKIVVASSQFVYGEGRYQCAKDGEVFPDGRDPQRLAKGLWEPLCPKCRGPIKSLTLLESDGGAVEMSSRIPVALGTKRGLNAFVFCLALLFCFVATMQAQCPLLELDPDAPPKPPSPHAADEALLPENGHLSNTTYTSDYFGFAFDLPIAAQGHLLMLPLMPERQHALLALQFENASHAGTITITAIEPRSGLEVLTPEQQQQEFNNWAASGSQPGRTRSYPIPDRSEERRVG